MLLYFFLCLFLAGVFPPFFFGVSLSVLSVSLPIKCLLVDFQAFEIDENIIHLLVQLKALDERWHHLLPLCSSERWKTECTPLVLRWLDCWETKAMEYVLLV